MLHVYIYIYIYISGSRIRIMDVHHTCLHHACMQVVRRYTHHAQSALRLLICYIIALVSISIGQARLTFPIFSVLFNEESSSLKYHQCISAVTKKRNNVCRQQSPMKILMPFNNALAFYSIQVVLSLPLT